MSHVADWAYGPQFAILSAFHSTLIPVAVVEKLNKFQGEHTFTSSAFSPPFDIYPRNITAWLAPNISIGAESFNETTIGGPAINPGTFNPAIIQWNTGDEIGYITVSSPVYLCLRGVVDQNLVVRHRARSHSCREPQQPEPHVPLRHRKLNLLHHRRDFQKGKGCFILG
jgi:hypothetical protein